MYSPPVSFLFSAFSCALLSAKLVHLANYATTIPPTSFLLYLPTFFLPDFIAICIARLFLRPVRSVLSLIGVVLATLVMLMQLGGAASQLGFFIKTGGELEWHEAKTYVTSKDGLKLLLTGSWAVMACAGVILAISWLVQNLLFTMVGDFLMAIYIHIANGARWIYRYRRGKRAAAARTDVERDIDSLDEPTTDLDADANNNHSESHTLMGNGEKPLERPATRKCRFLPPIPVPSTLLKLAVVVFLAVTYTTRPPKPYDHMSVTLPVSMLGVFEPEPDECSGMRQIMRNEWPLPDLIQKSKWEKPDGDFKGWAPGFKTDLAEKYRNRVPDWLPENLPRGFARWDPKRTESDAPEEFRKQKEEWLKKCPKLDMQEPFYNPVNDPLKISNLDTDILPELKETMERGDVKIKHVFYILMESLRAELFPIRQGSDIHRIIMEANEEGDREHINELLANLTPHIEQITGVDGGFTKPDGSKYERYTPMWNSSTREGYGGVTVQGSLTAATMSTKSFMVNHCGSWAMPVEKFEEADTDAYNPCMPQVLGLFNEVKNEAAGAASSDPPPSKREEEDQWREQQWYPALFESMTEEYDRQEIFDEKIGFQHVMTRSQLEHDPAYNGSDPKWHKVNYFGFPEPVLSPYIRDYIAGATASNQRIWLSHFTSTTHHAWDTPKSFERHDYLPTGGVKKWHEDFNKYLNTIRFHDAWMGELMQIIEEAGIADETLVVFAGDHGQAFKEDYHKTGTYETGHISDFRVPIILRHPNLPRVQYFANATTVSSLPTILDLLINTGSLNEKDAHIARDLQQEYEGQSLIRPYKTSHNGRRAWNFAVINSGAGMLAVTSADVPWRLVMPLGKVFEYTFTDVRNDPLELAPVSAWTLDVIIESVKKRFGEDAAVWVKEAEAVAQWWSLERKRLWRYHI